MLVTGKNSSIIQELEKISHESIESINLNLATLNYSFFRKFDFTKHDKFVFCAGVLYPKQILDQNIEEASTNVTVNMLSTIALCDAILEQNELARIVVMGSASGVKGSYDNVYAAAKAGIHQYIINKQLKPDQQLVAVAPSIIGDAGMTTRRTDKDNLQKRKETSPKKRFITSSEIANMIYYLLYVDDGFITNTIINMTGGEVVW